MPTAKEIFVCTNCDAQTPKWSGRCLSCGAWGTLVAQTVPGKVSAASGGLRAAPAKTTPFKEVIMHSVQRLGSGINEFDRVLGGGLVPGSVILVGGDPGIGKSTLLLQVIDKFPKLPRPILYVSGEESSSQIKMRADRLGLQQKNTLLLAETDAAVVAETILQTKPSLVIIDSIQTMFSGDATGLAGNMSQVSHSLALLLPIAKENHIPIVLIGHVTKEGNVAGPRALEHMVDAVLYLEGDRFQTFRILRAVKNRFGSTNEVGVFDMTEGGLREVSNPSELFLNERSTASGTIVTSLMEGTRALLVELQALTSTTAFGYPKRTTSGFDLNRLQLLLAVLAKRCNLSTGNQDVYINVVGGLKIDEPAADIAVVAAVVSSMKNKAINPKMVAMGEIGLGGEVRAVSALERRLAEAAKLGFTEAIIPHSQKTTKAKIKTYPARSIADALKALL